MAKRSARQRHTLLLFFIVVSTFASSSCSRDSKATPLERTRPVKTRSVHIEEKPVTLEYVGTTTSQSIKKYGFKMGGKIRTVYVEKGQQIKRGQKLALIDAKDLRFALSATELSLQQAQDAATEAESFYTKVDTLYQQKARPQVDYDKARLNRDIRTSTLQQARVDYEHKRSLLADAVMRSEVDGYVVDVLSKSGEFVGAGYPVVVIRGEQQVVSVGVSQRDIKHLQLGTKAEVTVDERQGSGVVSNISQVPDQRSRTYNVEVELTEALRESDFYIGSIAHVAFDIGSEKGMWVPLHAVQTDGADYVYVVEADRTVRRNITLGKLSGVEVQAQGLREGDKLIIEGMKIVREGYRVDVQ